LRTLCNRIVLALVLGLSAAPTTNAIEYQITDLGVLAGGSQSKATAINSSGQVVGYCDTSSGKDHAFLYSGGSMHDLGVLAGDAWSQAYGINDSGIIVGASWPTVPGYPHAFLYDGGSMQYFGVEGLAHSINNSNQVVGDWQSTGHGFVYSGGSVTALGLLSSHTYSYGNATSINSAGQIGGGSGPSDNSWWHAVVYASISPQDLGALAGATHSEALGINDLGQIVGYSDIGHWDAFLYSGGAMQDLGPGTAEGINNSGDVVGTRGSRAFLYGSGIMYDLSSLLSPGSSWTLYDATAINNAGQIVGYGLNPARETHAFLLTPVPEPPTVMLLAFGAVVAACLLRRHASRMP
jgi:probable HAF family extracellular repeat protein